MVVPSVNTPEGNGGCTPLWTRFDNFCYRYFGGPKTWEEAEAYCLRFKIEDNIGHLVSIHNKSENDLVHELWQSTITPPGLVEELYEPKTNRANGLWIGLEDREVEREWHWSDNSPVNDFKNWRSFQPNDEDLDGTGEGEDCVHMYTRLHPWHWWYGDWSDTTCDRLLPFVCKLPACL